MRLTDRTDESIDRMALEISIAEEVLATKRTAIAMIEGAGKASGAESLIE
jgi:hypothetical protein